MRWWALALVVGCYRPNAIGACEVSCVFDVDPMANGVCPGDLQCVNGPNGGICMTAEGTCGATTVDGSSEAAIDAAPVCIDHGGLFAACVAPTLPIVIDPGTTVIDTGNDPRCVAAVTPDGRAITDVCVVAGTEITITGTLRAIGSRPLVLFATGGITIAQTASAIDVASHVAEGPRQFGAGGSAIHCTPVDEPQGTKAERYGGAGGSFQGQGGNGGTAGAQSGLAVSAPMPTSPAQLTVVGGCSGGRGNVLLDPSRPEPGGGGGAVYLLAGASIVVHGTINASGGGAQGGPSYTGAGSGGGSGGLIAIDAPSILVDGFLFANGGGGSAGTAAGSPGQASDAGTDPAQPRTAAAGGTDTSGGAGGTASAATVLFGFPGGNDSTNNAGGGGGGAGFLVVVPLSQTANVPATHVSPPVTPLS
jgi:hypothetical protein